MCRNTTTKLCSHISLSSSLRLSQEKPSNVYLLNFKTTWLEFQKASHTATKRGEAKLHILNFKTIWSEFQKPSQTTTERGEAELRILDFETTWSEF